MPTASNVTETVIWTALPSRVYPNGDLGLSVFVSPRLSATMSDSSTPTLSIFPDFANWPVTVAGVAFQIALSSTASESPTIDATVDASVVPTETLDVKGWRKVFVAGDTAVEPYTFSDFSSTPTTSFGFEAAHEHVSGLYGQVGAASPTALVGLTQNGKGWSAGGGLRSGPNLINLIGFGQAGSPLVDVAAYYNRPVSTVTGTPKIPTLDFHQGIGALSSFPLMMRRFGLVVDLRFTPPAGIPPAFLVKVIPTWTSSVPATTNVSLNTDSTLTTASFLPKPRDNDVYINGMLNLANTSLFSVYGTDVSLAAHRLDGLSQAITSLGLASTDGSNPNGSSTAITFPAMRTSGPTLIWSGFADQLSTLAGQQSVLQQKVDDPDQIPPLAAEDVTAGHRIDVYTESDQTPAWRSLMGRFGTYTVGDGGSDSFSALDEGVVVPSASTVGTDDPQPSDMLYVSERLARWNGWGLSAQFPGDVLGNTADGAPDPKPNPGNPAPPTSSDGVVLPQVSAHFRAPNLSGITPNPLPFPKLRFGSSYKFRARAADLAGNGISVSSKDDSTATASFVHKRMEPVLAPVVAPIAPLTSGESTLFLVLLDDQVHAPTPNGRWLFPPKIAPMMAEQHGRFDGDGHGVNPAKPPDPQAYSVITPRDRHLISDAPHVAFDSAGGSIYPTPYFPGQTTSTPWLPDPLSVGAALAGVPGLADDKPLVVSWSGATWPEINPIRLLLKAGSSASHKHVGGSSSKRPVLEIVLPQAGVADMFVSSALSAEALKVLGVWDWVTGGSAPSAALKASARDGQVWMLSPYLALRLVHAVRLPLTAPRLRKPTTDRSPQSTSVDISDADFAVDEASTSVMSFEATWTDPYDDPTDPASDPSKPSKASRTFTSPAFVLQIPDPNPIPAKAVPMTITAPKQVFSFSPESENGGSAGSTHHIGDTKHHTIYYTATGSSRFAELFTTSAEHIFHGTQPVAVSTKSLGINPQSVLMTPAAGGDPLTFGTDFTVDAKAGTVSRTKGTGAHKFMVSFQPTVTVKGASVPVEVLSSARPSAPQVARIRPAWAFTRTGASTVKAGRTETERTGGYLRVFLERPWFSSGAHEMLGVVTQVADPGSPTPVEQLPLTTTMGLDPITYSAAQTRPWPLVPTLFDRLGDVPVVAGRPLYDDPPQLGLDEDPSGSYQIWPYPVHYDDDRQQWFADVRLNPGITDDGQFAPPPGYFVRLALTRFQPYSIDGYELSPLTLATIAQPVPDRFVTVVMDPHDHSHKTVLVSVSGPGYDGWRPPLGTDATQSDASNPYSPQVYSLSSTGTRHSSTMAVDVQIQDTSKGLQGDLAWQSVTKPVRLPVTFTDETTVQWGGEPSLGAVMLPKPITSAVKMRLRISELDFYPDGDLPAEITIAQRRPFVTFVPVN